MKTTPLTGTLTQLTLWGMVNAYLVREEDGFTLVDTTLARGVDAILAAARAAGAPIRRIALTHGHGDHIGGVDALRQRLGTDVELSIGELDVPLLAVTPNRLLRDGDRVGSLEVFQTPGHSNGHVAFLDTRDRTLIAGDVFTTIGGVEVTNRFNWRFPLPALGTSDKTLNAQSARKLRELEPPLLAVGHGRARRDPAAAMDAAIARA